MTPLDLAVSNLGGGDELIVASGPAFGAATLVLTLGDGSAGDHVPGASSLAIHLLDRGTRTRSRPVFFDALESLGASMHLRVGRGTTSLEIRGLAELLPAAADLLIEAMISPADDDDEWEALLDEIADDAERAIEDPSGAASRALAPTLWPGNPWGRPVDGTRTARASITRDAVLRARRRVFGAIARIGVSGDDGDALGPVARRLHEALRDIAPSHGNLSPRAPAPRTGALATITMDDPQAGMTLAWTAPSVHDPDWPAVALHHSVYAGGFTSPLVRRIRAEAGLSYDVSSDLIGGRDHSLQVLDISPESAEVGRVFDEVASCWQSFVADDLDADEVETARGRLLGGHAIGLETVRQRLRAAITQRWLGRPIEALTDLPDRVRNVTLDDLTRVATRWGPGASNVTAVVAAPVDALDDAAARVDLSRTEFDLDTVT